MITLHVLNEKLERVGVIQKWRSLSWEEEFQGKGAFTLVVNDTPRYASLLTRGCYLYRKDRETAMRVVRIERGGANSTIRVYGYSALNLLSFRAWKQKKTLANVEEDVLSMVEEAADGLPVKPAAAKGFEDAQETETIIDPQALDDAVLRAVDGTGIGLRMSLDYASKTFVFETYKGSDLSYKDGVGGYVFSSVRKNLESLTVTEDDDLYKNVAVIICGNDNDAAVLTYPEDASDITGTSRRELVVWGQAQGDKSEDEWKKAMQQIGKNALSEHNNVCTFTASPKPGAFGVRYDLGDLVTCWEPRYNVRFDAHITQFKQFVEDGADKIYLTLGRPSVSYFRGELIKYG